MIEAVARRAGLKLVSLEECPAPDLHLDGADEISPELDLIKGKGGALTREKILARAARRVVIVADQTKLVRVLGDRAPVPVEVLPFAAALAKRELMLFGKARLRRRPDGRPVVTDNGNYIIDVGCGSIRKPAKLERDLKILTGVIENGIFANLADAAVVGYKNGVRVIESRSDFDSLWQEIT
jgi:ribose 5-phosphate isomerase A